MKVRDTSGREVHQEEINMGSHKIINVTDCAADQDAATKKYVDDNSISDTHGRIEILPYAYSSVGQGTWALIINAAYLFCGYIYNTSHTDGDNISYDIYLDAGTYTLCVLHSTINNCGILDVDIDATEVDTFDCYSAAPVVNVKATQTGIVIASAGRKTLKLRVDGKHASSSDYYAVVNWISLWRTA